jgi:hypothetical protein
VKKSLTQTPKLKITRETLRSLNKDRLPEAVGGALTSTCMNNSQFSITPRGCF